jgi:Zn-dependent M28 family amino/carboxypeptidase
MLKNIDVTIQADSINQQWEKNWTTEYLKQLKICSGESDALMPDGKRVKFVRKNNLQADHQLQLMSDYLEDYYRQLGLKTWRQKFTWQGIPQENLIAQIGSDELPQTPVIFLDHYDTAFSEDVWAKNKVRQSNPGADDNCSATAGLMVAAKQLISSQSKLKRPIWIIHVTGEEFPADDLGARQFVSMLLNEKISPHAVIVMDMIAYAQKKADRKIFQISIGDGKQAALIGAIGNQVSHLFYKSVSHNSKSVVRYRFDDRSFLHQTDAIIFSDYGFPVVLFNEHLNQKDNWERAHYHQSSDLSYTLNIDYAAEILQTATETVRVLGLEAYLQQ